MKKKDRLQLERDTDTVMDTITGWTLVRTTYTLREDIFQKIARREKLLLSKPIAWLRSQAKITHRAQKKAWLVRLLLVKQFSLHTTERYYQVKTQRS